MFEYIYISFSILCITQLEHMSSKGDTLQSLYSHYDVMGISIMTSWGFPIPTHRDSTVKGDSTVNIGQGDSTVADVIGALHSNFATFR